MDLAIALPILKFGSRRLNPDGTMPTARIKTIWDQMYENGEVEMAEFGYQEDPSEVEDSSHLDSRERALLEQEGEHDDDNPFDRDWIIEFSQSMPPMIGLIWGGSIENKRREAG